MSKLTSSHQKTKLPGRITRFGTGFVVAGLIATGLCLITACPYARGQENQSLSLNLQHLETSYAITSDPSASLLSRLDNIEIKALGNTQQGSALERIERLNKNLNSSNPPAPPVPLTGTASFSKQILPAEMPSQIPNRSYMPPNTAPPGFSTTVPSTPYSQTTGDYFDQVMQATTGKIMRFKTMPIPVYITPFPDSSFTDACIKGFVAWEDASKGRVRFTQIGDSNLARIKVIWSHLGVNADKTGCTLGAHTMTKWQKRQANRLGVFNIAAIPVPIVIPNFGPKYTVPPQVIEVNLDLIMIRSPDVRYLVLKNIVTHELGHALGLLGHSPVKTDMMYAVTDEYSKLSQRDLNTLEKLYGQNKVDIAF